MDVQAWVQGAGLYDGEDDEVMLRDQGGVASIARRVSATSKPPIRPWAKKPGR